MSRRCRLSLANAHHASGSEQRADLERQAARTILEAIEAAPSVSPAAHLADRDAVDEQPVANVDVFRREGDYWTVIFDESTVRVRDLKGMHYLARLLADPGQECHVLDLVAAETSSVAQADSSRAGRLPRSALGDAGRCSTRKPRTPTADASPRSTMTSSRRRPRGTANGPHRPTPNATSCFENSPALSA